ncbi:exosome component [Babesia ovis]|uniref:Exosome component n=1 Tax=Babesia ovis TaxID=5869 RepID=A0A9W5WW25_BABOV|nr:exosome component [Babesia ovis]
MDMFVDLLDSQLQTPEDYSLLASTEEGGRHVESHLNKLISAASDAAKASNALPTDVDYSVLLNEPSFSSRLSGLSTKCTDTFSSVNPLFQKIGMDGYGDLLSSEALEALSDEIYMGLNVHHNDPHQAVSDFRKDEKTSMKRKAFLDTMGDCHPNGIMDQHMDYEARLGRFELEIHPDAYKRVRKHRQHRWKHLIDNFSMHLLQKRQHPKFNPIDPAGTGVESQSDIIEGPTELDHGIERHFVPKIYPKYDELEAYGYTKDRCPLLPHPYTAELNALEWTQEHDAHSHRGFKTLGGGSLMDPNINVTSPSGASKKCRIVQTVEELESMIAQLKECNIIGVDVEHHSNQSYRGFVCLVQITGADCDWIIDPFGIFDEMWRLNEVTTDPRILKVMHGAESDILWLQRDFGVYVVNLFDTLKAADVLCLGCGHSLSSLVKHFLGVQLDKSYQLADWRIRPIPRGMLTYASSDTHYLLDLYNALKNAALELDATTYQPGVIGCSDNRILRIMLSSRNVCLRQYRDPAFNEVARAFHAFRKSRQCPSRVDHLSLNMMLNLLALRNYAAKVLDESDSFLFPDYAAVVIATAADSKNRPEVFFRALVRHMPLLEREVPYLLKLRNTLYDIINLAAVSGLKITEPTSLSTVHDILHPPMPTGYNSRFSRRGAMRHHGRKHRGTYSMGGPRTGMVEIYNSLQNPMDPGSRQNMLPSKVAKGDQRDKHDTTLGSSHERKRHGFPMTAGVTSMSKEGHKSHGTLDITDSRPRIRSIRANRRRTSIIPKQVTVLSARQSGTTVNSGRKPSIGINPSRTRRGLRGFRRERVNITVNDGSSGIPEALKERSHRSRSNRHRSSKASSLKEKDIENTDKAGTTTTEKEALVDRDTPKYGEKGNEEKPKRIRRRRRGTRKSRSPVKDTAAMAVTEE